MANSYRVCCFLLALLLLGAASGGCQRASYAFRPAAAPAGEAAAPAPPPGAPASVLATPVPITPPLTPRPRRPPAARKPPVRLLERGLVVALASPLRPAAQRVAARPRRPLLPRRLLAPNPGPDPISVPPSKGVAVLLAVLLGYVGAHLFYLGNRRAAFRYLLTTLLCALLLGVVLVTLPVAASSGSGFIALFLALMAVAGIALVYFFALLDAIGILLNIPGLVGRLSYWSDFPW